VENFERDFVIGFWFGVGLEGNSYWCEINGNTCFITGAKCLRVTGDPKGVFEPAVRCFPTHIHW